MFSRTKQEPGEYELNGKQIFCAHCGDSRFEEGKAQLNTPGLTLLGLDWANRTATILVCTQCGRIEWYMQAPERL
jgi:uncharacterized protein